MELEPSVSPHAYIDLTSTFFSYRQATVDTQLFEGCLIKHVIKIWALTTCSTSKLHVFLKGIKDSLFTTESETCIVCAQGMNTRT